MITYPTIFFGIGNGPLKEDFEEYSGGALPVYDQIWQYVEHQWLVPKNPNKYVGFTWKERGVSGAYDDFESWAVGAVNLSANYDPYMGQGNFEIRPWSGFSAGFYRDSRGEFTSADQLRSYPYINFDWGTAPPINAYKSDFWSAKFISKLILPLNGTYQLYVERDEAARVFVGREDGPNTMIFNGWGTPPPGVKEACTPITYTAGEIDILIDFYEDTGLSKLKLYWSTPTVPGGGPTTPPVIIGPGDFGNSGYVRVFSPQGPFQDQGQASLDFKGQYSIGVIKAGPYQEDRAHHDLYMSGHYSLGVIYNAQTTENVSDFVNYAGYYAPKNVYQPFTENSQTQVDPRGLYIYRSAFSYETEPALNQVDSKGFYAYKTAFAPTSDLGIARVGFDYGNYFYKTANFRQPENVKNNLNTAGFYALGIIYSDVLSDQGINALYPEGFYKSLYAPYNDRDFGTNIADMNGNYFPLYVYEREADYGVNNLLPSGYYITGYVNTDAPRNFGGANLKTSGHYAYWLVTGDRFTEDVGQVNMLVGEGRYIYKNFLAYTQENVNHLINYDGIYFSRYFYTDTIEPAFNTIDPEGIYYPTYLNNLQGDVGANNLFPSGYYTTGYVNTYGNDFGRINVNPVGHYVSGFTEAAWADFGLNNLAPVGNYFFGIHTFYFRDDFSENVLGFDGDYRSIFIYFQQQEPSYNKLDAQGEYYWRYKPHRVQEQPYNKMFMDGLYLSRYVPTYDADPSYVSILPSGHYLTGFLKTYNREYGKVDYQLQGNYFYRFVYNDTATEAVSGVQDMNGVYFYRYLYSNGTDVGIFNANLNGYYVDRYPKIYTPESVSGLIDMQGLYFGRFRENEQLDQARHTLGFVDSLYYNTHPPFLYEEPANHFINFDGELKYRFVGNQTQEPAFNTLGLTDGSYFTRFCYSRGLDNSKNLLVLAGEYAKEAWISADSSVLEINFGSEFVTFKDFKEYAAVSTSFSGQFTIAKTSVCLDYWLEIYQRPTYNMGKSYRYFSQ